MLLIVPAFQTSPVVAMAQGEQQAERPALPLSAPASAWASFAAKMLLATAFLVGLVSTIAAST